MEPNLNEASFIHKNLRERSPTTASVLRMASWMEHKLSKNRHKGDRSGWLRAPLAALVKHLEEEVAELKQAIGETECAGIMCEAADVANLAMMVADKACWMIQEGSFNELRRESKRTDGGNPESRQSGRAADGD